MVLMLIIITGASFMLITRLNVNLVQGENIQDSYRSLEQAKKALIAYALTTPERSGAIPRPGPGYLPCPDTDNDGDADTPCGANAIGRLPYETLEEEMLMDDSGEVLWYALSDNFRFNPALFAPLNSDTVNTAPLVTLDGQNVVAIIFAPGPAFANQQRNLGPNLAVNYLENDNSNGDTSFISYLINDNGLTFNDRAIAITTQELMAAVEKRVLNEVNFTFNNYRNSFGAGNQTLPWLSPFTNPALPPVPPGFVGQPGTPAGHLPVHIVGGNYPNTSPMSATWSTLTGGAYVSSGIVPPTENCMRNSNCNDPDIGPIINPLVFTNAPVPTCIWVDANTYNCTGQIVYNGTMCWPTGFICFLFFQNLTRTYTYTINHTDDGTHITTTPDTAVTPRTRDLNTAGVNTLNGTLTIQAVDVVGAPWAVCPLITLFLDPTHVCMPAGERGRATLTLNAGNTGNLTLAGVDFHLDAIGIDQNLDGDYVDPGNDANLDGDFLDAGETPPDVAPELPPWFVNNNWHHLVYLAYPASEPVPGVFNAAAPAAGPGVCNGNCLIMTATSGAAVNQVSNTVRALAVVAGQDLSPATPRPNAALNDYFDIENSDLDLTYDKQVFSNAFNDQIRSILTTAIP